MGPMKYKYQVVGLIKNNCSTNFFQKINTSSYMVYKISNFFFFMSEGSVNLISR